MSETISLTDALAASVPEGALFHARCVLDALEDTKVRLIHWDASIEMPIREDSIEQARRLVGADVVATVLRKRIGTWHAIVIRSPSEHELWWFTRGAGVTVQSLFEDHRLAFESLAQTPLPSSIREGR